MFSNQCDQIWRFIGLWAIFKSLWQQLICPNLPTFLGNFYKDVKICHFCNNFWATFMGIWRFCSGHTALGIGTLVLDSSGTSLNNEIQSYFSTHK